MRKLSLDAQVREHLGRAAGASTGRSAETVYGGHEHVLRQTLIALKEHTSLAEHDNPGEATLMVLRGRVRLVSGSDVWDAMAGDLLILPPARHSLEALEDSAVLLTVAMPRAA
jgi:quercetin dioxygenase-like cupin family protein